ncbi:hypothetical protein BD310DRAFT_936215 [Dichomitus squalens]|uniref:Uncharacterized protein n=1 Tax=Dichomitus squalens TaxID=114155 RepID=A0A4Q9PJM9_9APHY|nr:hypothetical protein BD310DRAFT_936215 [Dichomitus squalens]
MEAQWQQFSEYPQLLDDGGIFDRPLRTRTSPHTLAVNIAAPEAHRLEDIHYDDPVSGDWTTTMNSWSSREFEPMENHVYTSHPPTTEVYAAFSSDSYGQSPYTRSIEDRQRTIASTGSMDSSSDASMPHAASSVPSYNSPVVFSTWASSPTSMYQDLAPIPGGDAPEMQMPVLRDSISVRTDSDPESVVIPSDAIPSGAGAFNVILKAESLVYRVGAPDDLVCVNGGQRLLKQRSYTNRSCKRYSTEDLDRIKYEFGCRLDRAQLGKNGSGIADYDSQAFPNKTFGQKASFRLEFEGYPPYTPGQINVTGSKTGQPTKGRFAQLTARVMERYIVECPQKCGRDFPYGLKDLVLLEIVLIPGASVQPFFALSEDAQA